MTPHFFQILVFPLYSLVFAQCIDPPPPSHLQIRGAALAHMHT